MIKAILSVVSIIVLTSTTLFSQEFKVDTKASQLKWRGEKVTGEHWGYVDLKSGSLTVENGKLTDGEFATDMSTITVKDLEPGEWNDKLLGHLKSDDFFSVAKHPESTFDIRIVKDLGNNKVKITGDLTIKGIKKQISFVATYKIQGDKITAEADMVVDRTRYDIQYGSGSFFDSLGDKTIYDDFTLSIKIVAKKS